MAVVLEAPAQAQVEVHYLPRGHRCQVDGQTYQCFSFEEYKELLRIDQNLWAATQRLVLMESEVSSYRQQVTLFEESLVLKDQQIARLNLEVERYFNMWDEENRLRLLAENTPAIGSWVAWGIAAVEAVALLIMAVAQ